MHRFAATRTLVAFLSVTALGQAETSVASERLVNGLRQGFQRFVHRAKGAPSRVRPVQAFLRYRGQPARSHRFPSIALGGGALATVLAVVEQKKPQPASQDTWFEGTTRALLAALSDQEWKVTSPTTRTLNYTLNARDNIQDLQLSVDFIDAALKKMPAPHKDIARIRLEASKTPLDRERGYSYSYKIVHSVVLTLTDPSYDQELAIGSDFWEALQENVDQLVADARAQLSQGWVTHDGVARLPSNQKHFHGLLHEFGKEIASGYRPYTADDTALTSKLLVTQLQKCKQGKVEYAFEKGYILGMPVYTQGVEATAPKAELRAFTTCLRRN